MKQTFRRVIFGLASAIAIAFSGFGFASPLESIRYADAYAWFGSHGAESAKLQVELVRQAALKSDTMVAVSSDLRRDSHGYRQSQADEELADGIGG